MPPVRQCTALDHDTDDRQTNATIHVTSFSFDRVAVDVVNPCPATSVLYYADAWHPDWRATVNGAAVPVFRANIAFKAVPVPPGRATVVFSFGAWQGSLLLACMRALALLLAACVLWIVATSFHNAYCARGRSARAWCIVGVAACLGLPVLLAAHPSTRPWLTVFNVTRPWDAEPVTDDGILPSMLAQCRMHVERGAFIAAFADCTRTIALYPRSAEAYFLRAETYGLMDEPARACLDYLRVLQLDPAHRAAEAAFDHLAQAAIVDSTMQLAYSATSETYFNRGTLHLAQREYDRAREDYRSALALDPSNEACRANLMMLTTNAVQVLRQKE